MRAHYLQHVPFEGLGIIEPWLKEKGYDITSTRFYESAVFPDPNEVDLLIVMGGPMSVNDEAKFPWLVEEKQFIRRCIEEEKSVLGICLGAQLIANSMGVRVYPNNIKEIGWFPIERKIDPKNSIIVDVFPEKIEVFHWHGDTFEIPRGAHLLASSEACRNQGFIFEDRVVGLQFHLETTPASAALLIENCRNELDGSKFVQDENVILANERKFFRINVIMHLVLEKLEISSYHRQHEV